MEKKIAPLHVVALSGSEETVKILVESSADHSPKDQQEKIAKAYAEKHKDHKLVKILKKKKSRPKFSVS